MNKHILNKLELIEKELSSCLGREIKINKLSEDTELYLDQILAYLQELNKI